MNYQSYQYLYPPRPENAIMPVSLPLYEARGYVAQFKKNGQSNIMAISPDRKIIAMNRHGQQHRQWQPSEATQAAFNDLRGGWYVFTSELIHAKVKVLRDINFIHDILVADSQHLTGTTFAERQTILADLFPHAVDHISGGYRVIDQHTWLAKNYQTGFARLFQGIAERRQAEDEGLVLKNPKARLALCLGERSNVKWQAKCRLPTKNYSF